MRDLIGEKTAGDAFARQSVIGRDAAAHAGEAFRAGVGLGLVLGFYVFDLGFYAGYFHVS
jgi:hypothetical protein